MGFNVEVIDLDLQGFFGYKYIFNPAIVRNDDGSFLLICRLQDHLAEGYLGIGLLDNKFNPLQATTIVRYSPSMMGAANVMLEDPRAFVHEGKIYLYHVESGSSFYYFCYTVFGMMNKDGFIEGQVILDYKKNRKAFNALKSLGLSNEKKTLPQKDWLVDKNWQFFIRDDKYYSIYQAGQKNEVFRFDFPSGAIREKYVSYNNLQWNYGRISGGAPPVLHGDGDYYSFFHSWSEWKDPNDSRPWLQRKYHIGVYVFENAPPFSIRKIASSPIFSGSDTGELAEWGHSVVFPGSALFDHNTREWIIALGWNDQQSKVIRFSHEEVTKALVPVTNLSFLFILKKELNPYLRLIKKAVGKIYRSVKTAITSINNN